MPLSMRIDKLAPLTKVELQFHPKDDIEQAVFLRIIGEGAERQAEFLSLRNGESGSYTWNAYRYNGVWSYGTSGGRLQLVRIIG